MERYEWDYQLKLLLVGDSGVGKTCVLLRYTNDSFKPTFITTIATDFKIKNLSFNKKRLKVQIWDMAGQERFRTITTSYFRGADVFMLVYDVTDRNSFYSIRNWIAQIKMHADVNKMKILIIGNKCDRDDCRSISWEEGNALAKEYKMDFFEVSAKTNYNITEAFSRICDNVMQSKYLVKESSMFQDHAVPIIIYGASSWWNKVKINGIYVPDCLQNYAFREHSALKSLGLFWYRNISTAVTTVLIYGGGDDNTWYVKDGTTILARISNVRSKKFEFPNKIQSEWTESVRVLFFNWTTNSPNLRCIPYDDEQIRPDIILKATNVDYVNMDIFVEYSKHPESLGLTVPLFVRFCQVKIAVLELNYDAIKKQASMDINELEHIYQQREDVEDKCSLLLKSLSQQETIKLLEIDRDTIIQAIDSLIIDLNLLFDTLVDIKNGNFTMAKNCQATITELINTKAALELSTISSKDPDYDYNHDNDKKNNNSISDNNNNNSNQNNINTSIGDTSNLEVNIGQIIISDNPLLSSVDRTKSQSKAYNFIRGVVTSDHNKKYSWYIKHCEIKWITIHEIKNNTDNELEEKYHITTGLSTSIQTTIGGSIGFTAGLFADLSSQLNIEMITNTTTNQSIQKERTLKVSRWKELKVEQEVIEGDICIERLHSKKSLFFVTLKPKTIVETFRVKKDSFRYSESDL
jgi:Ras-related protein Rab-8A